MKKQITYLEYEELKYKLTLAIVSHKRGKNAEGLREIEKLMPLLRKLLRGLD